MIRIVEHMDNRDIDNTRQLILPLNSVGGGGACNRIISCHDSSDYSKGSLFEQICSTENLFYAWYKFSKGKRKKKDVMIYERYLEENLFMLQDGLLEGSYIHSDYTPFIVRDPKERQIHKATVKDRVMHQAIFNIIEPIFERRFIFDSYSCRIGKGTHSASYRLNSFLRRSSRNDNRTVYVLKCDIKKFFDCIDHEILLRLLRRDIEDKSTIVLLKHILDSFEKSPAKGLPLGNLTSQLFVNIYLHELDYFVKHKLREKYYLRYCDDFVIVRPSRKHLLNIISIIQEFLIEQLKLDIHPDKISIRTWRQGIDFVGYVHMPHCIVLRNKTKKRMLRRIDAHNISSYLGLCKHADTFELQQLLLTKVADQNFIERY